MDNNKKSQILLFEEKLVRNMWDSEAEKFWFSAVDVIGILTDQTTQRGATFYWSKLKERLTNEGADQLLTNCQQLKMEASDGKMRLTDVADTEQILI
ncbi:MAG: hypothetical protein FWG98_05550 [Candidatus Cloacimonetes bacterium]|nr:hypothetical protein [Candidatus Cloacimonadota bacterium]